jgi:tetratricopeptide (TPR) repeat protein
VASMRNVERHLQRSDWISAIRECGCLLESVLHEIYRRTEPNLPSQAKSTIRNWERRKQGRSILKFTLGDLTDALKTAGVFNQAQIDFGRQLPYLLGAYWDALVPLRNQSSHANATATKADANFFAAYVAAFLEDLGWENFGNSPAAGSTAIHPFNLFEDFDCLETVINPWRYGTSEPQDVVSNVLLHSIQPAFYLNKLELLQDYSRRIGRNPDFHPMASVLVDARTIVDGACGLYGGLRRQESSEYFEAVKTNLEVPLTTEIDEKKQGSWPEAIRLDFLGLCNYHLHLDARKDGRVAASATLLENAKRSYDLALSQLDRLAVPPLDDVAALWKGYVLRNLGLVLADGGESKLAGESYRKALKERERVYQRLRHDCAPLIVSQLLVEVELVKIDIAYLEGKSDRLADSAARLLRMREDLPSIWPHIEERLYDSALALNAPAVAERVVLAALEDRLSHLTGKTSAQLVCVRSSEVVREVVVLRCRERQNGGISDGSIDQVG